MFGSFTEPLNCILQTESELLPCKWLCGVQLHTEHQSVICSDSNSNRLHWK